ncbi:hypothetical protein [Bradyrhizobium genosp. P]|uniref:hypothetical protein n=1 Tax=Bradyrhizobium genosp. P TaxID=83641 RepID=UPI003CEB66B1
MRKLFLISAFVLASATAHAGQSRSLVLAANDTPAPVQAVGTARPADPEPQAQAQPAPVQAQPAPVQPAEAQPQVQPAQAQAAPVEPQAAPVETPKHQASKPVKKAHVRHYEGDEAKARRIAARYGVYW